MPDHNPDPMDPELAGLHYPNPAMALRSMDERREYERRMRDWVAIGEGYGLGPEASMLFSLYL